MKDRLFGVISRTPTLSPDDPIIRLQARMAHSGSDFQLRRVCWIYLAPMHCPTASNVPPIPACLHGICQLHHAFCMDLRCVLQVGDYGYELQYTNISGRDVQAPMPSHFRTDTPVVDFCRAVTFLIACFLARC